MINFVLSVSGRKNLSFVGYSHGSSQMFAALANSTVQDKLKDTVNLFVGLGPTAKLGNVIFSPTNVPFLADFITMMLNTTRTFEFFSKN